MGALPSGPEVQHLSRLRRHQHPRADLHPRHVCRVARHQRDGGLPHRPGPGHAGHPDQPDLQVQASKGHHRHPRQIRVEAGGLRTSNLIYSLTFNFMNDGKHFSLSLSPTSDVIADRSHQHIV